MVAASRGKSRLVNDTPKGDTVADAEAWVEENMALVEEAYQRFLVDGTWPDVPSLQRRFDHGH